MRKIFSTLLVSCLVVALAGTSLPMGAASAQGPKEEVRFLIQETDPPSVQAYLSMEQEFEAEYPNYDVVIEFTNPDAVIAKVTSVVASGGVLDVFQPDPATAVRMSQNGQMMVLDDVVDELGGKDAFLPNALMEINGQTTCIPYASGGPVLWYRKDLFEAAGLQPPNTWDEWLADAKQLTGNGIYGVALPGGEAQYGTTFLQILMWQAGTETFNSDLTMKLAGNERAAEAVTFFADMLNYAPPGATSYNFGEVIDAFTSGRVATAPYWGRVLGRIYSDAPDLVGKVGAVPLPMNRIRTTYMDISYNCVYAKTGSPDGAKAWMEFMNRPEQAVKLQLTVPGHLVPVTYAQQDALKNSDNQPLKENPDIADVLFGIQDYAYNIGLNAGSINEETLTIEPSGVILPYLQILWTNNAHARAVQKVFLQGEDPMKALDEAQTELEAAIAEAG
jgi:ABC-type glycerol-3-phosphate transport system substrate-binding protein